MEGSGGRSKAQLIVGIDFVRWKRMSTGIILLTDHPKGTTFSGVAFAFATNTEAKEDIITEWPGAGTQSKQKVATVLYALSNPESDYGRSLRSYITISTKRLSVGVRTLQMRLHPPDTPNPASKR